MHAPARAPLCPKHCPPFCAAIRMLCAASHHAAVIRTTPCVMLFLYRLGVVNIAVLRLNARHTRRAVRASTEEDAMQRWWVGLLGGLLLAAGTACGSTNPSSANPSPSVAASPPASAPVSMI